jgi:hypothetical protein
MKGQFVKLVWIAIAITLITVGCSPSATQSTPTQAPTIAPPTQPPAPTATTAPSFPIGIFSKANLTWEIKTDGTYAVRSHTQSMPVHDDGTYTVTGNQVAIQGDWAPCKGILGTYTWAYDGQALSFNVLTDKCTVRRNVTDSSKWLKKP